MQVTHRYWATVGLASFLAVAGLIVAQPVLVVGAAVLGVWLVVQQAVFVRTVIRARDHLTVNQSVVRDQVVTDDDVPVVLEATLSSRFGRRPVQIDIESTLPPGTMHTARMDRRLTLNGETHDATTTFTVKTPVAGLVDFDPPQVTVTSGDGLFKSTFPALTDTTPSLTVVPRRPRRLHVGQGGDEIVAAFGNTKTGDLGTGLEPGNIREYVPGDTVRQIDWKATARSTSPHVREFEEETDRQTVVIVDQRESMATGTDGETKLDYARQLALAFVDHARSNTEPIGFSGIGDDGVTHHQPTATTAETYARIQTALHDMTPTAENDSRHVQHGPTLTAPRDARQTADHLTATDSKFAEQLQPYFEASKTYVQRVTSDPLYKTVQSELAGRQRTVTAVVVTDDRRRAEIRETVQLARTYQGEVLVFLAPTVLFEQDGLTDLDAAYDRYADFEAFRQNLSRLDRVSAYELAPGDRLETVLATQSTAAAQTPSQP